MAVARGDEIWEMSNVSACGGEWVARVTRGNDDERRANGRLMTN